MLRPNLRPILAVLAYVLAVVQPPVFSAAAQTAEQTDGEKPTPPPQVKRGYVSLSGALAFPYSLNAPQPTYIPAATAPNSSLSSPDGGFTFNPLATDTGYALNVAGGYRFDLNPSSQLRADLEFSYLSAVFIQPNANQLTALASNVRLNPLLSTDTATGATTVVTTPRQQNYAIMVNAYYDLLLGAWKPYIGVGIGYNIFTADQVAFNINPPTRPTSVPFGTTQVIESFTQSTFAYQARVGVAYAISQQIEAFLGYRYFGTTQINDPAGNDLGGLSISTIELGLRFAF